MAVDSAPLAVVFFQNIASRKIVAMLLVIDASDDTIAAINAANTMPFCA